LALVKERRNMDDDMESRDIRLFGSLTGPLLRDATAAQEFATLILRQLHGEGECSKQQPFCIVDQGDDWVATGSHQEPGRLPGTGAWFIRVRKSDCRVQKFGFYEPLDFSENNQN
jgi:hypothetical protein